MVRGAVKNIPLTNIENGIFIGSVINYIMKILKASFFIIILSFNSISIHAKQIKEEFKKYTNEYYNFSLFLPKKWKHTEMKNKEEFIITLEKDKYTSINLSISPIKKDKDWLKYPYSKINKKSVKILESDLESFKNKIVGKILVFEYKHDKKNILLRSYLIKYDKYMMLIECRSTIDFFYDYNDVFNKVMSSLKKYDSEFEVDLPNKVVYHNMFKSKMKVKYNDKKEKERHKLYKSKIEQDIEISQLKKGYKYISKHKKVEVIEDNKKFDKELIELLKKTTLNFTVDKYGFFTHVTGYKNINEKVKEVYPLHKEGKAIKQMDNYIIFFINYESLINTAKIINREELEKGKSFFTVFTYQNPAGEKIKSFASAYVKEIIKVFGREYIKINYTYGTDLEEFAKTLKVDKSEIVKTVGLIENKIKDVKYHIQGSGELIFDPETIMLYSNKEKRKIKYIITKRYKNKKKYTHEFEIDEDKVITNISIDDDRKN